MLFFRKPRRWRWYLLATAVMALDQATKAIWGEAHTVLIPGLLRFWPVRNAGMAFGLFAQFTGLIVVVRAVLLLLFVLMLQDDSATDFEQACLACIVGGTAGNLIDTVRLGHVVDFIAVYALPWIPVFNVADMIIVTGMALLVFSRWLEERP